MAINPAALWPGKTVPASTDYPQGSAQNVTTSGDGTGTPWEAALINDIWGFLQGLLSEVGATPTGNPDTATESQYLQAVQTMAKSLATINAGDRTYIAAAGDIDDLYLQVKTANDNGGGHVIWMSGLVETTSVISLGNNLGTAGYFGTASISNVSIDMRGVRIKYPDSDGDVQRDDLIQLVDATDCVVIGGDVYGGDNTSTSTRGGVRMAGCVRCKWYDVRASGVVSSLIVSGAQYGIGTRNGQGSGFIGAVAYNQEYWVTSTGMSLLIAANGAEDSFFENCIGWMDNGVGADVYDSDNAPRTRFVNCLGYQSSTAGAVFWSEGSEQEHFIQRVGCAAVGGSIGFGNSESCYTEDSNIYSQGADTYGFWSRNSRSSLKAGKFIDCASVLLERGGNYEIETGVIDNSTEPYIEVYNGSGFLGTDVVLNLTNPKTDRIYFHEGGADIVNIINPEIRLLTQYLSRQCNVKGGVVNLFNGGDNNTTYGTFFDGTTFISTDGGPVITAGLTHRAKGRNCVFRDLTDNFRDSTINHDFLDSRFINSPLAYDSDCVYLSGTTAVTIPRTSARGTYLLAIASRDLVVDTPGLITSISASGNTTSRTINNILDQSGQDASRLAVAWASGVAPTVAKGSANYDGIYRVRGIQ